VYNTYLFLLNKKGIIIYYFVCKETSSELCNTFVSLEHMFFYISKKTWKLENYNILAFFFLTHSLLIDFDKIISMNANIKKMQIFHKN
jgi:hypothetical protein